MSANDPPKLIASALGAGVLFGIGLDISGMASRQKVLGFLDILGNWDPSLAVVMIGAIAIATIGFALAARRKESWIGTPISLPQRREIDGRLIGGSVLFGIGWGLVGLCPGPAFVSLGQGHLDALLFIVAILLGAFLVDVATSRASKTSTSSAPRE